MRFKSFSKIYHGVSCQSIWDVWSDVVCWPKWDDGLEYCRMDGTFSVGESFLLKPKGAPKVKIRLTEIIPGRAFSDDTAFFGAVLSDIHEVVPVEGGVKITNKISMRGPLAFLWWRLVGKGVANGLERQTDSLVKYARQVNA